MASSEDSAGSPIRVLHLIRDLDRAGGPYDLLRLLGRTDPRRVEHAVAHLRSPGTLGPEFQAAGIDVIDLSGHRPTRVLSALLRLIRRRGIDIVHTNTRVDRLPGQLAALITGVPVVNVLRGFSSASFYGWKAGHRSTRMRVERYLDRRTVKHVIAVSDAIARRWLEHDDLCAGRGRPISVISAGVDLDAYAHPNVPERARRELGLPPSGTVPVILNVGHLRGVKGHRFLVAMMCRIIGRVPQVRLLIAGEGPERDRLEDSIRSKGLENSIRLLGRRDDVPLLLEAADVFVFPSYNEDSGMGEAFGIAAIEAMAAAKPVVAFDVPPFGEYIVDGVSGVLVTPGDSAALADGILTLLQDPHRALQIGRRARQTVRERFDIQSQASALQEIDEHLIRSRP